LFERYTLIGIAFSLAIVILDFYFLRKRRIEGKAFVLWFSIGLVVGVFSALPYLLELLTILFGTQELVSAVTATGFLFLLLLIFYLYSRISEIQSQLMKLAMEISVERYSQKHKPQSVKKSKSEEKEEHEVDSE